MHFPPTAQNLMMQSFVDSKSNNGMTMYQPQHDPCTATVPQHWYALFLYSHYISTKAMGNCPGIIINNYNYDLAYNNKYSLILLLILVCIFIFVLSQYFLQSGRSYCWRERSPRQWRTWLQRSMDEHHYRSSYIPMHGTHQIAKFNARTETILYQNV